MSSNSTLLQLRDAVTWALARGIRVRVGSTGVHCISTEGPVRWEPDPREKGVDPIGALILRVQPDASDLDVAEREVVGGSYPLRDGLADGMAASVHGAAWAKGNARAIYLYGWDAGRMLRLYCSGRHPVKVERADAGSRL